MATPVSEGFGEREHRVLSAVGRAMIPVADASTFPTCVGLNAQKTITALAKRTAKRLVDTCV
jgi:choline dehydrogenase-like flavoprotein